MRRRQIYAGELGSFLSLDGLWALERLHHAGKRRMLLVRWRKLHIAISFALNRGGLSEMYIIGQTALTVGV